MYSRIDKKKIEQKNSKINSFSFFYWNRTAWMLLNAILKRWKKISSSESDNQLPQAHKSMLDWMESMSKYAEESEEPGNVQ